jgi:pimeloyl-ACP methyl ester carboxylesterase
LTQDENVLVVINFHGNAGNVGQGYRPQTYKSLTSASTRIHVLTVDYRGFGRSTGIPSEAGLITDGVALVNFVLDLGIPPERIVLLGQSLGTQVASAVSLHFASPAESARLLPPAETEFNAAALATLPSRKEPVTFASVILAASFPSLPKLLKVYRLGGLVPLLSPLRVYPTIQNFVLRFIHECWRTSDRLAALVAASAKQDLPLNLQIMHAANDYDISWRMGDENFKACVAALREVDGGDVEVKAVGDWGETIKKDVKVGNTKVSWQLLMSGGHNRIVADVPIALAVMRGFGL